MRGINTTSWLNKSIGYEVRSSFAAHEKQKTASRTQEPVSRYPEQVRACCSAFVMPAVGLFQLLELETSRHVEPIVELVVTRPERRRTLSCRRHHGLVDRTQRRRGQIAIFGPAVVLRERLVRLLLVIRIVLSVRVHWTFFCKHLKTYIFQISFQLLPICLWVYHWVYLWTESWLARMMTNHAVLIVVRSIPIRWYESFRSIARLVTSGEWNNAPWTTTRTMRSWSIESGRRAGISRSIQLNYTYTHCD